MSAGASLVGSSEPQCARGDNCPPLPLKSLPPLPRHTFSMRTVEKMQRLFLEQRGIHIRPQQVPLYVDNVVANLKRIDALLASGESPPIDPSTAGGAEDPVQLSRFERLRLGQVLADVVLDLAVVFMVSNRETYDAVNTAAVSLITPLVVTPMLSSDRAATFTSTSGSLTVEPGHCFLPQEGRVGCQPERHAPARAADGDEPRAATAAIRGDLPHESYDARGTEEAVTQRNLIGVKWTRERQVMAPCASVSFPPRRRDPLGGDFTFCENGLAPGDTGWHASGGDDEEPAPDLQECRLGRVSPPSVSVTGMSPNSSWGGCGGPREGFTSDALGHGMGSPMALRRVSGGEGEESSATLATSIFDLGNKVSPDRMSMYLPVVCSLGNAGGFPATAPRASGGASAMGREEHSSSWAKLVHSVASSGCGDFSWSYGGHHHYSHGSQQAPSAPPHLTESQFTPRSGKRREKSSHRGNGDCPHHGIPLSATSARSVSSMHFKPVLSMCSGGESSLNHPPVPPQDHLYVVDVPRVQEFVKGLQQIRLLNFTPAEFEALDLRYAIPGIREQDRSEAMRLAMLTNGSFNGHLGSTTATASGGAGQHGSRGNVEPGGSSSDFYSGVAGTQSGGKGTHADGMSDDVGFDESGMHHGGPVNVAGQARDGLNDPAVVLLGFPNWDGPNRTAFSGATMGGADPACGSADGLLLPLAPEDSRVQDLLHPAWTANRIDGPVAWNSTSMELPFAPAVQDATVSVPRASPPHAGASGERHPGQHPKHQLNSCTFRHLSGNSQQQLQHSSLGAQLGPTNPVYQGSVDGGSSHSRPNGSGASSPHRVSCLQLFSNGENVRVHLDAFDPFLLLVEAKLRHVDRETRGSLNLPSGDLFTDDISARD